jgi:adenylylsulfate reductase, subunit A
MENRIVLTRFKDGYGPVGAYFLHLKTYTQNGYGEEYESKWYQQTKELVGDCIDRHPVPTCLRTTQFSKRSKPDAAPSEWSRRKPSRTPTRKPSGGRIFLG